MTEPSDVFGQAAYSVRFDWGLAGARATAADVAVVVDVLSFSTGVCIAVERGMQVYPYRWRDDRARDFAREHDAVLAEGRADARDGHHTAPALSPAALLACTPVPRLVLPSPNGSTISAGLQDSGAEVVAGCLRNADAVARLLADRLARGDTVAVIAAGERWCDDSLRPAVEDQLGAGAILAALARCGHRNAMSPEASVTAAQFEAVGDNFATRIGGCVSARELVAQGFGADVRVAVELDVSAVVPVLIDGAFSAASRPEPCSTPIDNVAG